jgi:hypothetical protein
MPSITPYQVIVPLLSALAIAYAWNLTRRGKKSPWEATLWTLFWGGLALIALAPSILGYLTFITGIRDQVNAILITLIGILFFLVFNLLVRIEDLSHRHTQLSREVALRDAQLAKHPAA